MTPSETLFHGGLILNSITPQKLEGFTVKDGKFEQVFTDESTIKNYLKRNPDCAEVSLKGKVVLPGQVDGHVISSFASRFANALPLNDITDLNLARARIVQYAATTEGALVAIGWQDTQLPLTREVLNDIVPDRELAVHNASFHGGVLNDAALKKAISQGVTPTPEMATSGRLWTKPYEDFLAASRPDPVTFAHNILAYQEQMLSKGITCAHDLLIRHADELQVFRALGKSGQLKIHWRLYTTRLDLLSQIPALELVGVHLVGHKIFVDGSYGMKTAWQDKAHAYADGSYGHAKLTSQQIVEAARATADAGGKSLAIHCIGYAACKAVVEALPAIRASALTRELRVRAQHFQTCDEVMLYEAQKHGLFINMQPAFSEDVVAYADRIKKPEQINQMALAAQTLKENFSLGSDSMPLGYLNTLEHALYPPMPHQRPADSLVATLPMATRNAARILSDHLSMGSIKTGMLADFTILNQLPRSRAEYKNTHVLETWVNGKQAWAFTPEVVSATA